MISDDSDCESDLEEIVLTISEDVEELGTGSTAVANDKKKSVINRHEMKEKDRFEDLTNNDVECESEEDETEYKIDIINEDVKSQMGPGTSIDQKFKPNASDYGTLLPHNVEEKTAIKSHWMNLKNEEPEWKWISKKQNVADEATRDNIVYE
ncbi:hypothetical protein JTB14_012924 [Gonioctena quinquepunctata]|nr:hypothetical protein JTB14_012924 [Gonioctena quinquepunctata]